MTKCRKDKTSYLENYPRPHNVCVVQQTLIERRLLTLANEQEKCQEPRRGEKVTVKAKPNLPTVSEKPQGKL